MILLGLLALAQAATPAPDEDVVVIAQKMRLIELDIRAPKRDGKLVLASCRVTRGSGIAELDAIGCQAARSCVADTLTSRKLLERCVEERSQPLLDTLVAARRAARAAQP